MVLRLWTIAVVALATLLGGSAAPAQRPSAQRIVAIGDLHGDHSAWTDIARAAGVIDARGRWSGGRTVLVQLGDVPDRGPDTLKIINDLMRLQKEAARKGGRVVAMVGNHEAMNMTGDLRYVDPGEYAAFATRDSAARRERVFAANRAALTAQYRATEPAISDAAVRARWMQATPLGWVEHRIAWGPQGSVGKWVLANPAVAVIGGNLFVHGGISAEYSKVSIDQINGRVKAAMAAGDTSETAIINDPLGPLWYRGLVSKDPGETRPPPANELQTVISAYGVSRIIVAHTPRPSGIGVLEGGQLVQVDTGNARVYNGTPSFLEIIGDRLIPHAVARSGRY